MFKIKNTRQIVIGFILFAIIFFYFSDRITEWIANFNNPLVVLLLSTLLNPIYIFFILSLLEQYGLRGMLAGFLIATAADVISLPHIYTRTGELSTVSYKLVSDTTFWNLVPSFLKIPIDGFNLGVLIVYVGVTSILIILALMITHKRKFKEIFMRSA